MVDRRFAFIFAFGATTATLVACASITGLGDDYKFTGVDGAASSSSSGGTTGYATTDGSTSSGGDANADGDSASTESGCSDGTREYLTNMGKYPRVAGCAGGWTVAGTSLTLANRDPTCNRKAGNDGPKQNGEGCSVEDLCADGWQVCRGPSDFQTHGGACDTAPSGTFFASRTAMDTTGNFCRQTASDVNNIVGCGTMGDALSAQLCGDYTRFLSQPRCESPWRCGDSDNTTEAQTVIKDGPEKGGVLCCKI